MQEYEKAHTPLLWQQKRRKQERGVYRIVLISGPVGSMTIDAIRVALGNMPLTWSSIVACVLGSAIGMALMLIQMAISYRTWLNKPERRMR